MFALGWILVGAGILFDLFELARRCVQIARRKGDNSATPLFGFLVSLAGVVMLRVAGLTLDSVIPLGLGLFFLHIGQQALFPFLLRVPFNYFAGHRDGLFDPLCVAYEVKKDASPDTSIHDRQAKARKRIIHGRAWYNKN